MPASGLTGSRIRERRTGLGLRQSALAKAVGISPAYLNLIEHNRRRIGGKLLVALARELEVEPSALTEGAEAALLAELRTAAMGLPEAAAERDLAEEFAGRFPGWAALVAAQQRRIEALEQTVAALTDRLTHDPQLAASMHEVLSVVTAIRATASILAEGGEVDPEWQARFHRNLHEDSRRLAESAQALVEYLDSAGEEGGQVGVTLPQEELEQWLQARGFHVAELEGEGALSPQEMVAREPGLNRARTTASLAAGWLARYREDARRLPLERLREAVARLGYAPDALARELGCDLPLVFRRLASLPEPSEAARPGLVSCDASGTLTFRKPVDGFPLPRYGAACPLWPLYQALARPMQPVRALVEQPGRTPRRFLCFALAAPAGPVGFEQVPLFASTMLILPEELAPEDPAAPLLPVGASCRICPRGDCAARREPSILTDGF